VTVEVTYPDGRKETFVIENRIVAQGRDFMLRNTIGVNTVNINYVAFSNDTTTPADNETSMPGTWVYTVTATKSQVQVPAKSAGAPLWTAALLASLATLWLLSGCARAQTARGFLHGSNSPAQLGLPQVLPSMSTTM
jgi:hypothetical protein